MARAPDERIQKAYKLYKQGNKLIDIANELNVPAGTVRRWKSTYAWEGERSDTKSERSAKDKESVKEQVKAVIENEMLNDKQRLFCLYYSKSFNATQSYYKAYGSSYATAMTNGSGLLRNARVREEIMRIKEERYAQALLKPEDIFQKYMDIAFADITDYLEFGREEVPVMTMFGPMVNEETKEPVTKVINSVRFKESSEIDGSILSEVKQGKDGASIKLADRMKALDWLTDHMNMATEEQKAKIALMKKQASDDNTSDEETGVVLIADVIPDKEDEDGTVEAN